MEYYIFLPYYVGDTLNIHINFCCFQVSNHNSLIVWKHNSNDNSHTYLLLP